MGTLAMLAATVALGLLVVAAWLLGRAAYRAGQDALGRETARADEEAMRHELERRERIAAAQARLRAEMEAARARARDARRVFGPEPPATAPDVSPGADPRGGDRPAGSG